MIYIKEYKIILEDEVSKFYEDLSKLQKKPIEEVLNDSLNKYIDIMMAVLFSSK